MENNHTLSQSSLVSAIAYCRRTIDHPVVLIWIIT